MQRTLGFLTGAAPAIMVVVMAFASWYSPQRTDRRAKPVEQARAASIAWSIVSVAAICTAALSCAAFVMVYGLRKRWPQRAFMAGLLGGAAIGTVASAWLFHGIATR